MQSAIEHGIIRIFRARTRGEAFETCALCTQGWWPRRIDPRTGGVEAGCEMVPPVSEQYALACAKRHLLKTVPAQSLIKATYCATCKTMVPHEQLVVTRTAQVTKGFEQVGGVFFDGLTSMSSLWLHDMDHRAGALELGGEKAAIGGRVVSGVMKWGGSTRSHVGFAQMRADEFVHNSLRIPNLIAPPVFTALTHEADDAGELKIRGPKLAGRAKTDEAPQWFGGVVETRVVKDERDREVHELRIKEFIEDGVRHLCKSRADQYMPDALVDEFDKPWGEVSLGRYLDLQEVALRRTIAEDAVELPDAPGIPEGIVEYGEPLQIITTGTPEPGPSPSTGVVSVPASVKPPALRQLPKARPANPLVAPVVAPKLAGRPALSTPITVTVPAPPLSTPFAPPRPPSAVPRRPPTVQQRKV